MRPESLLPIACLPLLAVIAACDTQSPPAPQPKAGAAAAPVAKAGFDASRKGQAAPADAFATPDGKPVTLAAFKGKPVLVNLWATWCAPCIKELPALDRVAARHEGKLTVLTVSQDMDPAIVPPWWSPRGFKTIAPYTDKDGKLAFAIDTGTLPTTVLYDADGREVWRVVGERDWEDAESTDQLKRADPS